jgi:hypothetical protein
MSAPRKHHFVPKFYLRHFADDRERIAQVCRKSGKVVSVQMISNAAAINHFYTAELPDGTPSADVEKLLGHFETEAAPVVAALARHSFPVSTEDRGKLAMYMAFQLTRGPEFRDFGQRVMTEVSRLILRVAPPAHIRSVTEAQGKSITDEQIAAMRAAPLEVIPHQNESIAAMCKVAPSLADILFREKDWHVLVSDTPALLTSDAPVTLWRRPSERSRVEGVGVQTADEILFPISPRTALLLVPATGRQERVIPMDDALVARINTRVALRARRWIFHTPDTTPLAGLPIPWASASSTSDSGNTGR